MTTFGAQLAFDYKRLFLRNIRYPVFVILMPIMFYILFTKFLDFDDPAQQKVFNATYLGSMIVYSVVLSAIFSLASLMQNDRSVGFVQTLERTPKGASNYYCSLMALTSLLNVLSVLALSAVAVGINHVDLTIPDIVATMVLLLVGSIPIYGLSMLYSRISSPQMLGIISNLTVFPLAIISGLWWPMNVFPSWLQIFGRLLPTWATNELIGDLLQGKAMETNTIVTIAVWAALMLAAFILVLLQLHHTKKVGAWGEKTETGTGRR